MDGKIKRYLLEYTYEYHYDAHGDLHDVLIYKDIWEDSGDEEVSECKEGILYDEDGCEFNPDAGYWAEDSYHCIKTVSEYKEITKEQYNQYSKILEEYRKI